MTAAPTARVVRGYPVRSPGGRASVRLDARTVAVCGALLLVLAGVSIAAMTTGDYPLSVGEVVGALTGRGDAGTEFIVTTLRLPRLLTGLLVGGALGASGAILQRLTRNPLGSPDFIGFTYGSATGALLVIILVHGGMVEIAAGALLGGLAAAVAIYTLAFTGGVQGFRLVLIGIGLSSVLLSANHYLITRATLQDALAAQVWLTGSLNGRRWEHVWAMAAAVGLLLPLALYYGRRLALLEMGDDAARALGVPTERTRLVLILVSVALAATATAAAGPIAFVALAAPQIARGLTRSPGPGLVPAAVTGALLLVASDFGVQRAWGAAQLPVGIATGAIGGLYLAWLLAHEWREGRP